VFPCPGAKLDETFSFRFRQDEGVLTIKDVRGHGLPPAWKRALAGRFKKAPTPAKVAAVPAAAPPQAKRPGPLPKSQRVVTGDVATLHLGSIDVVGPEIGRDARARRLWVHGPGAMQLPGASALTSPDAAVPFTAHFNEGMRCDGRTLEFRGDVH